MIWVSSTVRACASAGQSGTRKALTSHGAAKPSTMPLSASRTTEALISVVASRHAASARFSSIRPEKTGMKAEPTAPPMIRRKSVSGTRKAAR